MEVMLQLLLLEQVVLVEAVEAETILVLPLLVALVVFYFTTKIG
jgi:hypothetical protein